MHGSITIFDHILKILYYLSTISHYWYHIIKYTIIYVQCCLVLGYACLRRWKNKEGRGSEKISAKALPKCIHI